MTEWTGSKLDGIEARCVALGNISRDTVLSQRVTTDLALDTLELIAELRRLQELVKSVPFEEGDIVREVGEEAPTGEVIQVKEGQHETAYLVKLYQPSLHTKSITYYHNEIELIERPGK